jgi:peptide deformylase
MTTQRDADLGLEAPRTGALEIVRLGHPVLRQVAQPVPEDWFGSGKLVDLSEMMIRTMIEEGGVGLAAPQVAEPVRLFVFWEPAQLAAGPERAPMALVNPEVRPVGDEVEEGWEGCLSIPGLRGVVSRYRRVKVKARTVEGEVFVMTADAFRARVLQHEYDHLDGVVFLDRMLSLETLCFEDEWQRYSLDAEGES